MSTSTAFHPSLSFYNDVISFNSLNQWASPFLVLNLGQQSPLSVFVVTLVGFRSIAVPASVRLFNVTFLDGSYSLFFRCL